jgi:DNA repair ATPase RecN
MENNKILVNSSLSDNINIQNAFAELTNENHSVENSLYWINKYIEYSKSKDDKLIKIKKLLEISQANIEEAFIMLDNIVSK